MAHLAEVLLRAQQGDKSVLPEVMSFLDAADAEAMSPVAQSTEDALLASMYGNNLLAVEDTRRQLARLRRDLEGDCPTPLEKLLIERIAQCWLQVHHQESQYAKNQARIPERSHSTWQSRLDHAHRRYLSAIKSLAQVRRLQLPAVQLNIGEKQINLSQGQHGRSSGSEARQVNEVNEVLAGVLERAR